MFNIPENATDAFMGWYPTRKTRATPTPTGTVHTYPFEARQLAVIVGNIERDQSSTDELCR